MEQACRIHHDSGEGHREGSLALAGEDLGDKTNTCPLEAEASCRSDHMDHEEVEEPGEPDRIHEEDTRADHHQVDRNPDRRAEAAAEEEEEDPSFCNHHNPDVLEADQGNRGSP